MKITDTGGNTISRVRESLLDGSTTERRIIIASVEAGYSIKAPAIAGISVQFAVVDLLGGIGLYTPGALSLAPYVGQTITVSILYVIDTLYAGARNDLNPLQRLAFRISLEN